MSWKVHAREAREKRRVLARLTSLVQISHCRNCKGNWYKLSAQRFVWIVWVDKRYMWLVNGCLDYRRPIITIACPPKRSQVKSLRRKLVPISLILSGVGNRRACSQAVPLAVFFFFVQRFVFCFHVNSSFLCNQCIARDIPWITQQLFTEKRRQVYGWYYLKVRRAQIIVLFVFST